MRSVYYSLMLVMLMFVFLTSASANVQTDSSKPIYPVDLTANAGSIVPRIITCSRNDKGTLLYLPSDNYKMTTHCALTTNLPGKLLILTDMMASSAAVDNEVLVQLRVDEVVQRQVYAEQPPIRMSTDDPSEVIALWTVVPVAEGTHTVSVYAKKMTDNETWIKLSQLNVLFIPDALNSIKICGNTPTIPKPVTYSGAGYLDIAHCSLTVPSSGTLYILGTSNPSLSNISVATKSYWRVGLSQSPKANSDRTIDLKPNGNDGTDRMVTTMSAVAVTAGTYQPTLFAATNPSGTFDNYSAVVIGLFVASTGNKYCGKFVEASSTTANAYVSCLLNLDRAGKILALTSLMVEGGGNFSENIHLNIFPPQNNDYKRPVSLAESDDTQAMAISRLVPTKPGIITVSSDTEGDTIFTDPSVIGIFIPETDVYLPTIIR